MYSESYDWWTLAIAFHGDCRLLYDIWLEYGDPEDDESAHPETEMTKIPSAIKKLLSLLEQALRKPNH